MNGSPKDNRPRYCQIRDDILVAIREYRLEANQQIPTEVELMEKYGVSRTTVRRAVQDLVESGVLVKRQGNGTFVNAPKYTRNLLGFMSFTNDCTEHGDVPDTAVTPVDYGEASPRMAERLQMHPGEKIYKFERLRYINGEPVMIEYNEVAERYDFVAHCGAQGLKSMMNLFGEHGIQAKSYESVLQASYATKDEAAKLNVREAATILIIDGVCFAENGQPMYYFKQTIASDKCKIDISGGKR